MATKVAVERQSHPPLCLLVTLPLTPPHMSLQGLHWGAFLLAGETPMCPSALNVCVSPDYCLIFLVCLCSRKSPTIAAKAVLQRGGQFLPSACHGLKITA